MAWRVHTSLQLHLACSETPALSKNGRATVHLFTEVVVLDARKPEAPFPAEAVLSKGSNDQTTNRGHKSSRI